MRCVDSALLVSTLATQIECMSLMGFRLVIFPCVLDLYEILTGIPVLTIGRIAVCKSFCTGWSLYSVLFLSNIQPLLFSRI